jgi:hypothetical protein
MVRDEEGSVGANETRNTSRAFTRWSRRVDRKRRNNLSRDGG